MRTDLIQGEARLAHQLVSAVGRHSLCFPLLFQFSLLFACACVLCLFGNNANALQHYLALDQVLSTGSRVGKTVVLATMFAKVCNDLSVTSR